MNKQIKEYDRNEYVENIRQTKQQIWYCLFLTVSGIAGIISLKMNPIAIPNPIYYISLLLLGFVV